MKDVTCTPLGDLLTRLCFAKNYKEPKGFKPWDPGHPAQSLYEKKQVDLVAQRQKLVAWGTRAPLEHCPDWTSGYVDANVEWIWCLPLFLLKTYPPRQEGDCLVSTAEDAYTHAKDFLEGIQLNQDKSSSTSKYRDHREKNLKHVVSAS